MKKRIVKIVVTCILIVGVIGVCLVMALPTTQYNTTEVLKSDLQEIISETGNIESSSTRVYYANCNMEIKRVSFNLGHNIGKDNELFVYTDLTDTNKEEHAMLANFDGVVTENYIEEGAIITQGSPILKLESSKSLTANVQLSSENLENVEEGQKANITCGDTTYEGQVANIENYAVKTDGKPKVNVHIDVNSSDKKLYLGSEVDIDIFAASRDSVLVVPIETVYSDSDNDYVYVIENGVVTKKIVKVGISSDKYTEIKEGLSIGDIIITDNVTDADKGKKAKSR